MKADFSENKTLAFPLSLSAETTGPEVEGPTRFARALKRARFARGWTQAKLAEQLSITKRSIVSWETGARIPSVGMVVLLLDAFSPAHELSLHQELLCAYILDDLEREARRKDVEHRKDDLLLQRVQRVMGEVLQLPKRAAMAEPEPPGQVVEVEVVPQWEEREPPQPTPQAGIELALEPLFTLMTQLHQHPELIPVARDFIRELAPDQ